METKPETAKSAFGERDTQFFFSLTPEMILDAVEALGFRCTGRALALNSMENRVYEIEIDLGDEQPKSPSDRFRIVKFYRPGRWTRQQILDEHRFLLDLAEYEIPAVAPLIFPGGETLVDVPGANIWCSVFPKIGGRNPGELSDEDLPQVGRLLARLHGVGTIREAPTRLQITPETFGLNNLGYLIQERILPDRIANRYDYVVRTIADLTAPWFEEAEVQRIHGDAHLGDILHGPQGFFWVDFDDMLRGPCVQDLWLVIGGRDKDAQRKLSLLLSAYEQMRKFDRSTLRLIEPLRVLRVVHFNAWIARRWQDPAFPRTFVEFGTEKYWNEQMYFLEEQLELLQSCDLPFVD